MKKLFAALLALALVMTLAACGGTNSSSSQQTESSSKTSQAGSESSETANSEPEPAAASGEAVKVSMLSTNGGNDSNTELVKYRIEEFNKKYAGQYELEVEWIPGVAEDIRTKLKMLNAANDLPAIVGEMGAEPAFADLLMRNNRLIDLMPYFEASPEWQETCIPESIAYNTTEDGKMFSAPNTTAAYAGMYYNKELFAKAGIEKFPETLEEFWDACETLKAAGITPISLHTTETGWCPMIFATARLALTDAGKEFSSQMYPTNFDTPEVRETFEIVKRLFDYSTADAVGGNYALAANNFASGNTAMIPNGPWMIPGLSDPQFAPEGFAAKVGYAAYPDKVMITTGGYEGYSQGVSVDVPKEAQEGAVEYLKFLATPEMIRKSCVTTGDISPIVSLTEEDLEQMDPIMKEYSSVVPTLAGSVPNYQGHWDPITQNEVIPTELVNYITEKITLDELLQKMNEAAEKYAAENN